MMESELIAALKGEFSDHTIITVQLACSKDGQPAVYLMPAVWLSENWALHQVIGGMRWTCTHTPTGYNIGEYGTMAQALMALGAVITLDLPWHLILCPEDMARIMRDLPVERKQYRTAIKVIKGMDAILEDA
jgi:hypothetical protein